MSLCREIEYIRSRYKAVISSIECCNDTNLKKRLLDEVEKLIERKNELKSIANSFITGKKKSDLTIQFFLELCKRPLGLTT